MSLTGEYTLSHCAVRADTELVLSLTDTSARVRFDTPDHPLIYDRKVLVEVWARIGGFILLHHWLSPSRRTALE